VIAPPSRKSAATTAGDNRAGLSRISRSRHAEHALSTAANPACCVIGQARRARRREPRHHRGPDTYNPRDNFLASAAYLREIFDRYGSSGFLAAYNAGPARYDEHLATGRPLPPETKVYIAMLSPMMGDRQSDGRTVASFDLIAWARATLFATHPETPPNVELPAAKVQPDRLPSVRRIVDLSTLSPQSEGLFVHPPSGDRPNEQNRIPSRSGRRCRSFGDSIKPVGRRRRKRPAATR